jgi:hypothetical protein
MSKYAAERIWRTPDGELVAEGAVKDGQAGGLGTSLAYAAGDAIEPEDEDKVGKLGTSHAPDAAPATGLTTAAGTSSDAKPSPTKAELQARAEELGLSKNGNKDELAAAIAEEEKRRLADEPEHSGVTSTPVVDHVSAKEVS